MKKIKVLLFTLLLLACTKEIYGADYTIKNYKIDATVQANGDLKVKEDITVEFRNRLTFNRNIPRKLIDENEQNEINRNINIFSKQYENKEIINLNIGEITPTEKIYSYKQNNEFSFETSEELHEYSKDITNLNTVGLKIYAEDDYGIGEKRFFIEYTIKNLAIAYTDTAELFWNFFGEGIDTTIENLNINIIFPYNDKAKKLEYFSHGIDKKKYSIEKENIIKLELSNVESYKNIGIRVLFPEDQISNSSNIILEKAKKEIKNSEANKPIKIENESTIDIDFLSIIQIILIVIFASYFIYLFIMYEKDELIPLGSINAEELYLEYDPLIAGCIAQNRNLRPRDIVATLLNLVNKRVLKLKKKKRLDGEYIYEISKDSEGDISKLNDIETYIYDWFFIEDDKIELLSSLKAFSKSEDTPFKLYRLQQLVDSKLHRIGARGKMTDKKTKTINNLIFGITCMFVFFHIIYIIFIDPVSEVATSTFAQILDIIIFVLILLLPFILIGGVYIWKILLYRKIGMKRTIKIPLYNFITFILLYGIIAVICMCIDIFLFNDTRFTLDIILIIITSAIMLSDKLVSKNDKNMIKVASKFNIIKSRIENDILKNENSRKLKITDYDITYGMTLGVNNKILKNIEDKDILEIFNQKIMKKSTRSYTKEYYKASRKK